jgi:hypothetical protein
MAKEFECAGDEVVIRGADDDERALGSGPEMTGLSDPAELGKWWAARSPRSLQATSSSGS